MSDRENFTYHFAREMHLIVMSTRDGMWEVIANAIGKVLLELPLKSYNDVWDSRQAFLMHDIAEENDMLCDLETVGNVDVMIFCDKLIGKHEMERILKERCIGLC